MGGIGQTESRLLCRAVSSERAAPGYQRRAASLPRNCPPALVMMSRPRHHVSTKRTNVLRWLALLVTIIPARAGDLGNQCTQTTEYLTENSQPDILTRFTANFGNLTKLTLDALTGLVTHPDCVDSMFVARSAEECEILGHPLTWSDVWHDKERRNLDRDWAGAQVWIEDFLMVGNRSDPDSFKLFDTRLQPARLALPRVIETLKSLNKSYRLDTTRLFSARQFSQDQGFALRLHLMKNGAVFTFEEIDGFAPMLCKCGMEGYLNTLAELAGQEVCTAFHDLQKLSDLVRPVWTAARQPVYTQQTDSVKTYQTLVDNNMLLWSALPRQPPLLITYTGRGQGNMTIEVKRNLTDFATALSLLPADCAVIRSPARSGRSIFDWITGSGSDSALRDNQQLAFRDLNLFHSNQRKLLGQLKKYRLYSGTIIKTENKLHLQNNHLALEVGRIEVQSELDARRQSRNDRQGRLTALQVLNWELARTAARQLTMEVNDVVERLGGLVERCRLVETQSGGAAVGCGAGGASVRLDPPGVLTLTHFQSHRQLLPVALYRCLPVSAASNRSAILRNVLHGRYFTSGNATHLIEHNPALSAVSRQCLTARPPPDCYTSLTNGLNCFFIFMDEVLVNCINKTMIVTTNKKSQLVGLKAVKLAYQDFPLVVGTKEVSLGWATELHHFNLPAVSGFQLHTAAQSHPSFAHIQGTLQWNALRPPPRLPTLRPPAPGQYQFVRLPWYATLASALGSLAVVGGFICCCCCCAKYGWCELCCPSGAQCAACCGWAVAWSQPAAAPRPAVTVRGPARLAGSAGQSLPLLPPAELTAAAPPCPQPSQPVPVPGCEAAARRVQEAWEAKHASARALELHGVEASSTPAERVVSVGQQLRAVVAATPAAAPLLGPCDELLEGLVSQVSKTMP